MRELKKWRSNGEVVFLEKGRRKQHLVEKDFGKTTSEKPISEKPILEKPMRP